MRADVVVVWGGGRGIGRAVAVELARRGTTVAIVARSADQVADAAAEASAEGGQATAHVADATRAGDVEGVVEEVCRLHGRIDATVVAAGSNGPVGPAWTIAPHEWAETLRANTIVAFNVCRFVVPKMIPHRRGKIVLFGGGGSTAPVPMLSAYGAAKAAIARFAETLAVETAEHGLQVNVVAPGLVDTTIHEGVVAAGGGAHGRRVAEARATGIGFVPAALAADLVAFLVSSASGRLTGKLISAAHDDWRSWGERDAELNALPLYTVRRVDAHTVLPLVPALEAAVSGTATATASAVGRPSER